MLIALSSNLSLMFIDLLYGLDIHFFVSCVLPLYWEKSKQLAFRISQELTLPASNTDPVTVA